MCGAAVSLSSAPPPHAHQLGPEDFRGASAGSPFENFWAPVCAKTNFSSTAHTSTRPERKKIERAPQKSVFVVFFLAVLCHWSVLCWRELVWAAWAGPAAHWENTFLVCSCRTNISTPKRARPLCLRISNKPAKTLSNSQLWLNCYSVSVDGAKFCIGCLCTIFD